LKPTPTGRLILEAARGHMPGYVDTGLNIVHVDDVAAGELMAAEHGGIGERYILGGENMSLAEILGHVAHAVGKRAPRLKVPYPVAFSAAALGAAMARVTGHEPFTTLDGVRMSRKKMYFSSEKAERALGYNQRPARDALADAVAWFAANGYLGAT
jgi:dihydroflavonol-4-reductase